MSKYFTLALSFPFFLVFHSFRLILGLQKRMV
jgi:hypothetical protein